jgi:hypothetical protein
MTNTSQSAERRSLLVSSVTSINEIIDNEEIFKSNPLIRELFKLKFSLTSINSILNCGIPKDYLTKKCGCGKSVVPITNHCDCRTCKNCGPRRKARFKNKYLRFLQYQKPDGLHSHLFITIGPPNYQELEFGLMDIRKKITKWRRHDYIKERIKAGLYVIESKQKEDLSWNVHSHMIAFSRHLDNHIRGNCLDCKQNLMKFDKQRGYFCANQKCNSENVIVKRDSKLKSTWRELFNEECHFHVKKIGSVKSKLNYMLKYISTQKEDFQSVYFEALYIKSIKGKRLITAFGGWYKIDLIKFSLKCKIICNKCNSEIIFEYDPEEVSRILYEQSKPPPDPSMQFSNEKPIVEVIKI